MAGIAGLMYLSQIGSIATDIDPTYVLYAVAAAVIGGTSLYGGRGKPLHAVLGGIVIAAVYNGIYLIGLGAAATYMVTGVVLLVAVTVDSVARRGGQRAAPDRALHRRAGGSSRRPGDQVDEPAAGGPAPAVARPWRAPAGPRRLLWVPGRRRRAMPAPWAGTLEIPWNRSLASVSALSAPFRARFLVLGVFSARFRQKWRRETAVAPRNRNRAQKTPSRVENDGSRRHGWSTDPQICAARPGAIRPLD